MSTTEERLIDLEIRSAEHQRTLDELSDVINGQWSRIDEMTALVEAMRSRLRTLEEKPPGDDAPPPHY